MIVHTISAFHIIPTIFMVVLYIYTAFANKSYITGKS